MTDIFDPINQAFAGFVGSSAVQLTARLIVLYAVIVWVATAWWAFRDSSRRTDSPPAPFLVAGVFVLATPVFFLPIAVLYRVIRPPETLAEATERGLTESALEAGATRLNCPSCEAPIKADWRLCPYCRHELLVACPKCAQPVDAAWSICPWCVKELPWAREPVAVFDEPAPAEDDAPLAWPSWNLASIIEPVAQEEPIVWPADWEERVAEQAAAGSGSDRPTGW
ncbi:MAG TPA: zinc ribbon domain-containing protein [Candidatus Limnocylindrales bacterium]|jgi:hypothetical protein